MAPNFSSHVPRLVECFDGYCTRRNSWYDWGRWIVVGIIILLVLVLMSCTCVARRRRRRGAQPMYGTGWMAPSGKPSAPGGQEMNNYQAGYNAPQGYPDGYNQAGYGGYTNQPPPPPAYGQTPQQQQYTGTTFNTTDGYYGDHAHQQQYGVQQPPSAYQPDAGYSAPAGPPPGK